MAGGEVSESEPGPAHGDHHHGRGGGHQRVGRAEQPAGAVPRAGDNTEYRPLIGQHSQYCPVIGQHSQYRPPIGQHSQY